MSPLKAIAPQKRSPPKKAIATQKSDRHPKKRSPPKKAIATQKSDRPSIGSAVVGKIYHDGGQNINV